MQRPDHFDWGVYFACERWHSAPNTDIVTVIGVVTNSFVAGIARYYEGRNVRYN